MRYAGKYVADNYMLNYLKRNVIMMKIANDIIGETIKMIRTSKNISQRNYLFYPVWTVRKMPDKEFSTGRSNDRSDKDNKRALS
jgi:hypothetical protein